MGEMGSDQNEMGSTPWQAYALAAAGPIAFCFINIWSRLHDQTAQSALVHRWEMIAWEGSSAIVTLLLLPFVAFAVAKGEAALAAGWLRTTQIHIAAATAFFILHVAGFIVLRHATYAAFGSFYSFGGLESWIYELPKDLITYMFCATIIRATSKVLRVNIQAQADNRITIREGTRTYFVKPEEIVAVNAAGNYAEFRLADGQTPLMRTTLSALERCLGKYGIVRTHRSWLINTSHIAEISPTGGGDYRLILQSGFEAALSRRYAKALNLLKPKNVGLS